MNTATIDAIAIVLRRSLEIGRDGFCALMLFFMNRRAIELKHRGRGIWHQCHAGMIAR
jgi:hypothetical protein